MKRISVRQLFYEIHLWLGIVSGIILFVVCLSGTIYTFRDEVERALQPSKYYVPESHRSSRQGADALIENIETEYQARVGQIVVPTDETRTWIMRLDSAPLHATYSLENAGQGGGEQGLRQGARDGSGIGKRDGSGVGGHDEEQHHETEKQPERREGKQNGPQGGRQKWLKTLYVDPCTGKVLGEGDSQAGPFFLSMMRLHRFLWLPDAIGRPIVGIATIIFGVLLLTGMILWLPRTLKAWTQWKIWRIGLKVRLRKGWKLFLYDIHNTLGFYMFLPLLIMTLTGLCWSFGWYRDAVSTVLGDKVFKQREVRPMQLDGPHDIPGRIKPMSIQAMIDHQDERTPGGGLTTITIPPGRDTAVVVDKQRTGFFTLAFHDKTQWDRVLGKAVAEERFADLALGAKIAAFIKPLHLGDFFGTSSKILYFIACLIATTLPLSGTILWFNKWRLARKKRRKTESDSPRQNGEIDEANIDRQVKFRTAPSSQTSLEP